MIDKPLRNYLAVALLVAAVLMGGRTAWQQTVKIGCLPPGGTSPPGTWMDGCASDQVGSLGLDVLWFATDRQAVAGITGAKVLLFGDSRMLGGMSNGIASTWFAIRNIPMYLMAFGAGEQSGWAERLVAKWRPQPELLVFDTDPYFTGEQSIPAQVIADDPAAEEQVANDNRAFFDAGPTYCRYLSWLCGRTEHNFRRYLDGTVVHQAQDRVWFGKNQNGSFPIARPGPQDRSHYDVYLTHARALLAKFNIDKRCVVFTILPNSEMDDSLARFLAEQLGARVVAPRIDGLSTVDHFHLAPDSAQIWTKAFFAELEPVVQDCVGRLADGGIADGGIADGGAPLAEVR
jgi:hypothetical protein